MLGSLHARIWNLLAQEITKMSEERSKVHEEVEVPVVANEEAEVANIWSALLGDHIEFIALEETMLKRMLERSHFCNFRVTTNHNRCPCAAAAQHPGFRAFSHPSWKMKNKGWKNLRRTWIWIQVQNPDTTHTHRVLQMTRSSILDPDPLSSHSIPSHLAAKAT